MSTKPTHDVFLSFRTKDTFHSFTDSLYFALIDAGLTVLNYQRPHGDSTEELIRNSKVSVVVFSRNYTDSIGCLEELVKMVECRRISQKKVFPVFYDVDPSDVRNQRGDIGVAFGKYEERFELERGKVKSWRAALTEVANLSGWDLRNSKDRYEADMIKIIVKEIFMEVRHSIYPVGIGSHVQYLNSILHYDSNDVRIIGIYGKGGIGKTTIARAVYNRFFHCFEGKSFLANVREMAQQPKGQIHLQKQLLCDILKLRQIKINSVDQGIDIINERLCNRRILIVLDDIDQPDQLMAIAWPCNWLSSGSRVILTARDKRLLEWIGAHDLYEVEGLSRSESLELLSWYALRKVELPKSFLEYSQVVVDYCEGVPLRLKIFGSLLFGRTLTTWKMELEKLKTISLTDIYRDLRITFDSLDDEEKEIFLDIACFFNCMDKDSAAEIMESRGLHAEIGISVLCERCLLTVDLRNKLIMHDLLQCMGREIVHQESPTNPGKRSRLWCSHDVIKVLENQMGTDKIEALVLEGMELPLAELSTETFVGMKQLRFLQLNGGKIIKGHGNIFQNLKWLHWHKFPSEFLPDNFHLAKLVALDMQYSNLQQLWRFDRFLGRLQVLNLSYCFYLTKTPDFSKLPSLEKLVLKNCTSLVNVHSSVGHLSNLVVLNVKGCVRLRNLPRTICMLKNLKFLNLCHCSKLIELPEDIGSMESLTVLLVDQAAIRQVPSSIVQLKNLRILSLCGCNSFQSISSSLQICSRILAGLRYQTFLPISLTGLGVLARLNLQRCNLSDDAIPKELQNLSSLEILNLRGNLFKSLPVSIGSLSNLKELHLADCANLRSLPEVPSSLQILNASGCKSLERILMLPKFCEACSIFLANCSKLVEVHGLENSEFHEIHMEGCNSLSSVHKEIILQNSNYAQLFLPGSNVPECFSHLRAGTSFTFQVTREFTGLSVCIVHEYNFPLLRSFPPGFTIFNRSRDQQRGPIRHSLILNCDPDEVPTSYGDHTCVFYIPRKVFMYNFENGDQAEVVVNSSSEALNVKSIGAHLWLEPSGSSKRVEACCAHDASDVFTSGEEYTEAADVFVDEEFVDAPNVLAADEDNNDQVLNVFGADEGYKGVRF